MYLVKECDNCHHFTQLDKLREEGVGSSGSGNSLISRNAPNMESTVLLHNIQRVIQVGVA